MSSSKPPPSSPEPQPEPEPEREDGSSSDDEEELESPDDDASSMTARHDEGDPALERPASPFDTLDASKIVETAELLAQRIHERFPTSSLSQLCDHLVALARDAQDTAVWIGRPNVPLRIATAAFSAVVIGVVAISVSAVPFGANLKLVELIAAVEAAINDIILIGAALIFLVGLESRIKRHRALQALHRLRSLAHITDMHQLAKAPERLDAGYESSPSSPAAELSAFELGRYLDYCTEMLSLTGKIAAVYIQDFDDSVALQAVNEIEDLTTGLSRKIWQKRTLTDA